MDTSWLFNLGADVYAWFTAQAAWRASCGRMAALLATDEPRQVLDLGCGPGVSTFELARRLPRAHLIGLDVAPRMLAQARRRTPPDLRARSAHRTPADLRARSARRTPADSRTRFELRTPPDLRPVMARDRICWLRGDAARLPFADHSLDACTGHSFLYLVADRTAVLHEALRVLRPGGQLVLMEPHARPATLGGVLDVSTDLRHLVSVSLWRPFSRLHGRFSAESLAATLAAAGFEVRRVEPTLGGLGLLAWATAPR